MKDFPKMESSLFSGIFFHNVLFLNLVYFPSVTVTVLYCPAVAGTVTVVTGMV